MVISVPRPQQKDAPKWRLCGAQSCSECCGEDGSLLPLKGLEGWLHSHTAVP